MSSNNDNENPVQKIRHLCHVYPQKKDQFLFTGLFITNSYIHTLSTLELDNKTNIKMHKKLIGTHKDRNHIKFKI